mmetsp:Transcript_13165/g.20467  ORF Transcript_13165/g.20467 Transcript_13165/m.20467 type:complete len:174 (+) Transcript_13165:723-1244(+)
MKDVFIPDNMRLAHCRDFKEASTILEKSRFLVSWAAVGVAAGAYEAALKYCLTRKQFGKPIAKFQLIQEKLSRMLTLVEMMISHNLRLSNMFDEGKITMGQITRSKSGGSKLAREVCSLAREVCGGNGILLENHVIKQFMDAEAVYTYEGTYEVNTLVSGRELTGGLSAFNRG